MDPRNKVSRLLTADIARLVTRPPVSQARLDQLAETLEVAVAALRREAVAALVRRQRIERELGPEGEAAAALERRRALEMLRAQVVIEERARELRRDTEVLGRGGQAALRPPSTVRAWVAH
jgi:hypothetical protein